MGWVTRRAVSVVVVSFIGGAALAWGAVGDISEGAEGQNDPPMFDLPNGTGLAQVVVAGTGLALLFGGLVGWTLRVLAARTTGANIGGGILLFALPAIGVGVLAYLATALGRVGDDGGTRRDAT